MRRTAVADCPNIPGGAFSGAPDLDRILRDVSIDVVIIATPPQTHVEIAISALSAGKHVFVEKPLATNPSDARRVQLAATTHDRHVLVDYTFSMLPVVDTLRDIVASGTIGSLKAVSMSMAQIGRFNTSDVYALLGSHMLAVLDRLCPIESFTFRRHDMLVRDGVVETGLIVFGSNHVMNSPRGVISVSLNDVVKRRELALYGDGGTIKCDLAKGGAMSIVRYRAHRTNSDRPVEVDHSTIRPFDEEPGLNHALSAFHAIINGQISSNLERAVLIDEVLGSLARRGGDAAEGLQS